ncbi:transcription antitermination factor NusB [Candidatus Enterovibrio escicola]|uniref:transcription antitermination factor NusB n=1 Tax=Candidatus Enterovibrio escicola TaxID=1927127 RepID=UPI0012381ECE|nr:transcription antitermination factor NusB [Candidatus Enterovibrio escacola]
MKPATRRNARRFALQAIYSWQLTKDNIAEIEAQFLSADHYEEEKYQAEEPRLRQPDTDVEHFRDLFSGVVINHLEMDNKMRPYLSRPLKDLDQIEHALLRLATYELCKCEDVPFKVVINEAIEMAKRFCSKDSHKFVNGVLDKVAPTIRKKNNLKFK